MTTSIHITALDGIVNVNSLFTLAVFIGLAWNPTDPDNSLVAFHVYSFASFLFSSLIALGLKQAMRLNIATSFHFSTRIDPVVYYVNKTALRFGMVTSGLGSVCGLINSNHPFLWVVRSGSVGGTEWVETIPEEIIQRLKEKGKIVKWASQQDVLKHRAIGGFLTHNGWNSTVESICEGVPMMCLPFRWEQMLNAGFVTDVWMVGIHLENRIERDEVEGAIRRLYTETEGKAIRERMKD